MYAKSFVQLRFRVKTLHVVEVGAVAGPSCRYVEPRDPTFVREVGSHVLRHRSSSREQTPTSREVNRLLMQPHTCWAKGPRLLVASIIWLSEGGICRAMPVDWVISARPGGPGCPGEPQRRRSRIHAAPPEPHSHCWQDSTGLSASGKVVDHGLPAPLAARVRCETWIIRSFAACNVPLLACREVTSLGVV